MPYEYVDESFDKKPGILVIYFAGGCFWGMQKLMQSIQGVVSAVSGYANGESIRDTERSAISAPSSASPTMRTGKLAYGWL